MEKKEHRRRAKRFPICWKAAIVFDKADGRPILHTETQDLSAGGAAIRSEHEDLKGRLVTLLIAQPVHNDGETPKMMKVRARVVSSVRTPPVSGYRHGMSFLRSPGDGLDFLEGLLSKNGAAQAEPALARAEPVPPAGGGRLAQLRQQAQEKLSQEKKDDAQQDVAQQVSDALGRAYDYLKELAEQLNVVQPAYARGYTLVGVPEFGGLAWENGRADQRSREIALHQRRYEQASLSFRLSGGKQIRVGREHPASERLRQALTDNKIEFKARDERNDRGSLVKTVFEFACEVRCSATFDGEPAAGRILLKMRNVERFGLAEHRLRPEAVTREALEEFASFVLGETHRVGALLKDG